MAAAGFDPKAVDMVVISHFRLNGLLTGHTLVPQRRSVWN